MDSIWKAEERINYELTKIEKFNRLWNASTPANQVYVMGKVETITTNFLMRPNARPFGEAQAKQIYLALIEFLELPEAEQAKRIKQAGQYKTEGRKIR